MVRPAGPAAVALVAPVVLGPRFERAPDIGLDGHSHTRAPSKTLVVAALGSTVVVQGLSVTNLVVAGAVHRIVPDVCSDPGYSEVTWCERTPVHAGAYV